MKSSRLYLGILFYITFSSSVRGVQKLQYYVGSSCPYNHDSECHSLSYYAEQFNFTNNSDFIFSGGDHDLIVLISINGSANISFFAESEESASNNIVCDNRHGKVAGFSISNFVNFALEMVTLSNCKFSFLYGMGLNLMGLELSYGLLESNFLEGNFVIANSTFNNSDISLHYIAYEKVSSLVYSRNVFMVNDSAVASGLNISINDSTDVHVLVTDSNFECEVQSQHAGLGLSYLPMDNNSVQFNSTVFRSFSVYVEYDAQFTKGSSNQSLCTSNRDLSPLQFVNLTITNGRIKLPFAFTLMDFSNPVHLTGCNSNKQIMITDSTFADSGKLLLAADSTAAFNYNLTRVAIERVNFLNFKYGKNVWKSVFISIMFTVVQFEDCNFKCNTGSVIQTSSNSTLIFAGGINVFSNNIAYSGAAIQLENFSYLYFFKHTYVRLIFEDNHAITVGGAILVSQLSLQPCFFQLSDSSNYNIDILIINNTANYAGSFLYGGNLNCSFLKPQKRSATDLFNNIFGEQLNSVDDPSVATGDPGLVCLCSVSNAMCVNDGSPEIDKIISVFPGEEFNLYLAVVDQSYGGVVPGVIHAFFSNPLANATFEKVQSTQFSEKQCSNFTYSILTMEEVVNFYISVSQPKVYSTPDAALNITVYMKNCPLGFILSKQAQKCVCDPALSRDGIKCYINSQEILSPPKVWIGLPDNESLSPTNETSNGGILVHLYCPTGYCIQEAVNITSNDTDSQCEPHRTGILCGECEEGYSLTLGQQKCAVCSNNDLMILLPLAAIGILLVIMLFAFDLTVAQGSLNGLIFYANIVGLNPMLSPDESCHLYFFIAWLNLNLGIDMCLFDGMDAYSETWLQFVFPFYLWLIIFAIILSCNVWPILSKNGCNNIVQVLATLLLMSYTKLQQTVVTILSFTSLEYPSGVVRYVWLYDANVDFFKGKHLCLFMAAILVLIFLIIPYTLALAFFQHLQAWSTHKYFFWVNKFKPVFDSYAGPYKDKYRMWTGVLLVIRILLIILFTVSVKNSINLLIILVVSFLLLAVTSCGIYKKWQYNFLESFFYAQLGFYAGGVLYARNNGGNVSGVKDASITFTVLAFIAILGYHISYRISALKSCWYKFRGYSSIEESYENSLVIEREESLQQAAS